MKAILYVYIVCISFTAFGQNSDLFEKGKEQYKAENFQEALNTWTKIIDNGSHSSELYFNLGNAHYKLNNIGPSIYYYEKALLLNPGDSDIKNNLAFARNATIDVVEPLPETFFKQWYKNVSGVLTFEGWARSAVVFSILAVGFFLLYYFSIAESRKRFYFVAAVLLMISMLISLVIAFKTFDDAQKDRPAIIFAESSEVKSEPNMGSENAFVLHEGTKVQVIASDGDWMRILLADGKDGWIPSEDLKEL